MITLEDYEKMVSGETESPTDEQKARLREAYRQAQAGEVYSQEEAHRMMDEFVSAEYAVAV